MFVMFSPKTVPFTSTGSKTSDVRTGRSSRSGVPRDTGPLGKQAKPRGPEENATINIEGARPDAERPGLAQANLKRFDDKDPVAAALTSVVSSLPPSETTPIPVFEEMAKVANAGVKTWRRAARKGKGKHAALGPMFGPTLGDDTFEIPYGECDASASAHSSQAEPNGGSKEPTPLKERKARECLDREPSPRGVAPERSCVAAVKLGLDEIIELLYRVLGAGDEDPDVSVMKVRRTGPCHYAGSTAYSGSFRLLLRDTHCPRSHQCFNTF